MYVTSDEEFEMVAAAAGRRRKPISQYMLDLVLPQAERDLADAQQADLRDEVRRLRETLEKKDADK